MEYNDLLFNVCNWSTETLSQVDIDLAPPIKLSWAERQPDLENSHEMKAFLIGVFVVPDEYPMANAPPGLREPVTPPRPGLVLRVVVKANCYMSRQRPQRYVLINPEPHGLCTAVILSANEDVLTDHGKKELAKVKVACERLSRRAAL